MLDRQRPGRGPARQHPRRAVAASPTPASWPSLEKADLASCQVVIAATGDDKVNLVVSLLAKTEFGVPRVVARVNHPKNEWMFNEAWGVDVAVSTPRMLSALVEEAVSVGDLVRLFTFRQGDANLVELTLPAGVAATSGTRVGDVQLAAGHRAGRDPARRPGRSRRPPDDPIEAGDELLFVAPAQSEEALQEMLSPHQGCSATPVAGVASRLLGGVSDGGHAAQDQPRQQRGEGEQRPAQQRAC